MKTKQGNRRVSAGKIKKQPSRQQPTHSNQMSADERRVYGKNARQKKNMRKKLILRTAFSTVFVVAAIVIVVILFFNINTVNVTGDEVYSDSDITAASGVEIGNNLIFLSSGKINKNLTEKLPYIGSVKIKRHLPATLEIIVTKTKADYAVMTEGSYALLDKNGKVLEKGLDFVGESIIVADLGKISSAEAGKTIVLEDEQIFAKLMELQNALSECGFEGITSVNVSNIYDVKLVYQGRITLLLGETDSTNMLHKLLLGKETIKTEDEENDTLRGTVNLTVSGKAYWSEEKPTEAVPQPEESPTDENNAETSGENSNKNNEESTSAAA